MMSNYVIAVYVSSDPGTYMVHIQFTFQIRVWQLVWSYRAIYTTPPWLQKSKQVPSNVVTHS
jgi:hypothetical protein